MGGAYANDAFNLSFSPGITQLNSSSEVNVELGAEYEYRVDQYLGVGVFGNYVFNTSGVTLLGVPEIFVHPWGGDWMMNASPVVELGTGAGPSIGARFGTRIALPLGPVALVPQASVDFYSSKKNLIVGLGIQF